MTLREREHAFLVGAPMAIVPALAFLPTVTFLIIFPQVRYGRAIGLFLLPVWLLSGGFGLWKLAGNAVDRPWGLFNALSLGAIFILVFIAGYTGLFLAIVTLKL